MSKKGVYLMLLMCLLTGVGTSISVADSGYLFAFNPPFGGCAKELEAKNRSTSPRVSVTTVETDYWHQNERDTISTTYCLRYNKEVVSSYVKLKRGQNGRFSYITGGTKAGLLGYPTNTQFDPYTVGGYWQP